MSATYVEIHKKGWIDGWMDRGMDKNNEMLTAGSRK